MSHLWWIPVPGGRERLPGAGPAQEVGILRVLIVPVLDQPLADAGLADWPPPELTGETTLTVTATPDGGGPPVTLAATPRLDVVEGAWQEFFGRIGVVPSRGLPAREIVVDPTADRVDRVTTAYATAARALFAEAARPEFQAAVTAAATEAEAATREEAARRTAELESLRDSARTRSRADANGNGTSRDKVDFNLAIGLLREHPAVLECLGLVLTLRLPKEDLDRLPQSGTLGVTWPDAPAATRLPAEIRYRRTAYSRGSFLPRPKPGSPIAPGGMVMLQGSGWRLHTIDPDLPIAGLTAVAVEAQGGAADPRLPAIKTSGILLGQIGRKSALTAQATPAGPQDTLFADDLVLGYRIDARDADSGKWHSLMSRTGTYRVNGRELTTRTEEGHVKTGGGTDVGDEILRASEVVARWDGWSLAVPRPRLGIGPVHPPVSDPPGYHLDVPDKATPNTLPRLEFGRSYQLRARVADIAGGGPAVGAASPDRCDSAVVPFARLEPLLPPDVRLPDGVAATFGPGAAMDTLVIRAPEGSDGAPGPADPRVPDPDTTRELGPPRGTFDLVERHHRLAGDRQASLGLVTRDHLPDPAAGGVAAFIAGVPGEAPADLEFREWVPGDDAADAWPDLPPKRLVLLPRTDDAEPTLVFADAGLLVVRLDPAQEATLEISSTIHGKERSSFLVSTWLGPPRGQSGPDEAGEPRVERAEPVTRPDERSDDEIHSADHLLGHGRHPMATPPHLIRVRHAVRLPRGTAAGTLAPRRGVDATYVELRPDTPLGLQTEAPDPVRNPGRRRPPEQRDLVGIDPASTAAVEVAASWAPLEDVDDPATSGRHVGRVEVSRGARVLPPIRHEIGDTKHRRITYTLTAVSRFRDCYPDADTAPDSAFTTVGEIGPVSVPSSARPPAPVVRAAVPGFVHRDTGAAGVGDGTVVRTRLGNRVRLELAPPWYATGDGERLVVLHRGSSTGDDGRFTQAGRDPIWATGEMERFPVATGQEVDVVLQHLGTVKGVPHTAWRAGDSWWVDVAYPSIPSYGALVQLAVVRWQPHSLLSPEDLTTSSIVRTDWVPLLPERTLTVRREGDQIVVVLSGLGPQAPLNRVDVLVESPVDQLADGQVGVAGDDGLWMTEPGASGVLDQEIRVVVRTLGNRVRVREVEQIPHLGPTGLGTLGELSERVVFTDTVPV